MVLIVTPAGRSAVSIAVEKDEVSIGRDPTADVVLPDGEVSGLHARLFLRDGKVILRDLDTRSGTRVNGRRIARPVLLRPTDIVRIGGYILQLGDESADRRV